MDLPAGSLIANNSTLTIQGFEYTFRLVGTGGPREIVYSVADTPLQVRTKVQNALQVGGLFTATNNPGGSARLTIRSGTVPITMPGNHSSSDTDVRLRQSAILINQSMTASQVLNAVKSVLALNFNANGQTENVSVWKSYQNTIQLYGYTVDAADNLGIGVQRPGDFFGPNASQTNSNARFNQAGLRGRNNNNEGVYIDDIIIAPAERGELVINSSTTAPAFQQNYVFADGGYVPETVPPVAASSYQLEIRTAADFTTLPAPDPLLIRRYDSNARLTQQLNLVVDSAAGAFKDGDTFTLSDGKAQLTFEFDIVQSTPDRAFGVTSGRVPIRIAPEMTANQIATVIRDAINGTSAQSIIKLKAGIVGEISNGAGGYLTTDNGHVVELHGPAAGDLSGSTNIIAGLSFVPGATETALGEDGGDSNRRRDQGQILINSNTVRSSSSFGIVVDHASRSQTALANFVGDRPYPGAVANLVTNNTAGLAPGVVVVNNIVASNLGGGIRISGDNAATPEAVSNIARVVNNTVFGSQAIQQGILVEQAARATILNNILANLNVGIAVTTNAQAVLGSNIYQSNVTQNVTGTALGANDINLPANAPLFIDPTNSRFYLAALSQAIDSSNSALPESSLLSQVKNSVGLPASPLLAPDRDIVGVVRVDDPAVTSSGQGPNIHIDRGAVERSDSNRLKAVLVNPLDNDSASIDVDRNSTYVRVLNGNYEYFSILLSDDQGSGPDPRTVLSNSVLVSENGRRLIDGVDYTFGYNAGSNTIRLTPLAGLWRRDSVYEIALVNKPTGRVSLGNGSSIADGDNLTVTLADGTSRTVEFDSGFVVDVPQAVTAQLADTQTITYQRSGGVAQVFEMVLGNRTVGPNVTPIGISSTDTYLEIAEKIATALAGVIVGGTPVKHFGLGRIHVGGSIGDQLSVSNRFIVVSGQPGVSGSLELAVPPTGGAGITDGQSFSIRNAAGTTVVFEFDNDTFFTATNRVITYLTTDTADVLAGKLAAAISASGLGLLPTTSTGGIIRLNEPRETVIDLRLSSLTSTGVPGGAIPFDYIPSPTTSAYDLALQTIQVLNQLGQGVKAYSAGSGTVLVEGSSGMTGTAVTMLTVIRDIAGNSLDTNRSNATTQFTIVMPDVAFDFGDAPGANAQTLQSGNGARHAILPPDTQGKFLGTAPDSESDGQPNAMATGDDGSGNSDEDGVVVSGVFNTRVPATNVSVNASGSGIVDAWIDWNRDGDFTDVGEQVITNQPVFAGNSTFVVQTPLTAVAGGSFIRVRFSTLGNLLSGGVGIGGEVEDHAVQIIRSFPPVLDNDTYTTDEETPLQVTAALGVLNGDSDADGHVFTVFDSDTAVAGIQPVSGPSNGSLTLNADGSFTYSPNLNFFGTDTFVYHAVDSLGVRSATPATVTIMVSAVNDAPEFTLSTTNLTIGEDGVVNGSAPGPVSIPNFITAIRPGPVGSSSEGTLTGFSVTANDPSLFSMGPAVALDGTLSFTLAPDRNNVPVTYDGRITITLTDDGSSTEPNINSSSVVLTVTVTPINDAPIPDGFSETTPEEMPKTLLSSQILLGDRPGPATATDENTQTLTIVSVQSTSANGGTIGSIVLNGNDVVSFTYTPATDFVGIDIFTYTLSDNATGGVATALGTISISVTGVNDPPEFTIPAVLNASEDDPPTLVNGFATGIRPGPIGAVDETGPLTFDVVASDLSFFSDGPRISPDGTLAFTLAPNRNGSNGPSNEVVATLRDGPLNDPNTRSFARTFLINVAAVNDPPEVVNNFETTVAEDSVTNFTSSQILTGNVVGGPNGATDEASQTLSIIDIDQRSSAGGVINFSSVPITTFRYIPAPHFVGRDTFTYQVADSGSPSATTIVTVTVNVTAVNDAPEFTLGPDVSVNEDSAAYSQPWATGIRPGPTTAVGESNQTVDFTVTPVSNASFFTVAPSIGRDGILTFTPARNAVGIAVFSVVAVDTGEGTAPNVNSSTPVPLTITLLPVNDAPIFTAGGNVTVDEDAGPQSQAWSSAIFPAAGLALSPAQSTDESGQIVSFVVLSNSNPGLFSTAPAVSSNGLLSFTTVNNRNGSAVIVLAARDDGAVGTPNQNESAEVTFTINVTPVNDPPVAVDDTNYTTSEDAELISAVNQEVTRNDSDPDGDTFTVVSGSSVSTSGATVTLNADGSFRYDPRSSATIRALLDGQMLNDTFAYRLIDANITQSSLATVTVTVQGKTDAPRAVDDTFPVSPGTTTSLNILANDVDLDTPITPSTVLIGIVPANGTATVLSTGRISYTPNAGFRGIDTFTYTVRDSSNLLSNEATVTIRINTPPTALNDSAMVLAGSPLVINVLANDSDADGNGTINSGSVTLVTLPSTGTATVQAGGTIRFTVPTGFTGSVNFTYTIADANGAVSTPATVNVSVVSSLYQNPAPNLSADVNNDGFVTPIDALIIINDLQRNGTRVLPVDAFTPPPFLDVNGDGSVSPIDVLIVINSLNRRGSGEGENALSTVVAAAAPLVVLPAAATSSHDVAMVSDEDMIRTVGSNVVADARVAQAVAATQEEELPLDGAVDSIAASKVRKSSRGLDASVDDVFGTESDAWLE